MAMELVVIHGVESDRDKVFTFPSSDEPLLLGRSRANDFKLSVSSNFKAIAFLFVTRTVPVELLSTRSRSPSTILIRETFFALAKLCSAFRGPTQASFHRRE